VTPEQATVGRGVVYRAHPEARPEDGRITSVHAVGQGIVHVLYDGDGTAKATRLVDLEPVDITQTSCADCGSSGPVFERRGKSVCDWCSHRYWPTTDAEKAARGAS
jgi:hypothetical protein